MKNPKRIFINAATVKISGGLIVALDIINYLVNSNQFDIFLICPDIKAYRNIQCEKSYVPNRLLKPLFRFILDHYWIPQKINKNNPELVVNLGNLPSTTHYPQIIFSDNAFISEPEILKMDLPFSVKLRHAIRKVIFLKRLKKVKRVYVQTQYELERFIKLGFKKKKLRVLPPHIPNHLLNPSEFSLPKKLSEQQIRLVCVSNYFVHKNIEVLVEVLDLAALKNMDLQIVFLLNPKQKSGGATVINSLKEHIKSDRALNIGNQNPQKIKSIIRQCDGVILPSKIETFGLNCLEAWYCHKPYFVSDLQWSRSVCDDAAIYFNCTDAADILRTIEDSFYDNNKIISVVEVGIRKLAMWNSNDLLLKEINDCIGL